MNLTRSNEHVPEIERQIRVVKYRARCVRHRIPFNRIPRLLLFHILFVSVKILNFLPTKRGVSTAHIPKTILYGGTFHYKRHLALNIVQYCQFHEEDTSIISQSASKKSRNIPWFKWKHPRWIQVCESSLGK